MNDNEAITGGGNVFADLGVPYAETALAKADAVLALSRRVRSEGLASVSSATGIPEEELREILHGRFADVALERLAKAVESREAST